MRLLVMQIGAVLLASLCAVGACAQTAPVNVVALGPRDNSYFVQVSAAIGTCTQANTNKFWVYVDATQPNYESIRDTLILSGTLQRQVVIYLDPSPCVLNQGAYYSRVKGVDLPL